MSGDVVDLAARRPKPEPELRAPTEAEALAVVDNLGRECSEPTVAVMADCCRAILANGDPAAALLYGVALGSLVGTETGRRQAAELSAERAEFMAMAAAAGRDSQSAKATKRRADVWGRAREIWSRRPDLSKRAVAAKISRDIGAKYETVRADLRHIRAPLKTG